MNMYCITHLHETIVYPLRSAIHENWEVGVFFVLRFLH